MLLEHRCAVKTNTMMMQTVLCMLTIIMITLFPEDNIFGTNASLTYGPQLDTKTYMRLIITDRTKIIYSMYRACEVSVHRACCEWATQPYSLGREVRFI